MRVAILGDTHMPKGSRTLPELCVETLLGADVILHTGDLIRRPVLEELRAFGPPVHAVHGNVDGPDLRALLPETLTLDLEGVRVAMIHDSGPRAGRARRMRGRFPDADLVVFGHSHMPLHETEADGLQLLNPGSPTERRRAPTRTMAAGDVEDGRIRLRIVDLGTG